MWRGVVILSRLLQLRNFKTAASFARRLLELGPKPDVAAQVCGGDSEGCVEGIVEG